MAAPHVQVCDCCGCESERLFQSPDSTLWLCVDCFIDLLQYRSARRAAKAAAAEAASVTITDDEAGTEWTIYE